MARRRYRRNDGGVDPIPWVIGGVLVVAAYLLYEKITGGQAASGSGGGGTPFFAPGGTASTGGTPNAEVGASGGVSF